ncbi:MAG: helix-turn-helix domain-containing protein [Nocardioidaceae bacterium]
MAGSDKRARIDLAAQVSRAGSRLTGTVLVRMEEEYPWFRKLSADSRSFVALIVQRAILSFADWLREPGSAALPQSGPYDVAPPEMAKVVSLRQTVSLVRVAFAVVEESIVDITDDEGGDLLHTSLLEYAREVAFATAEVYARAAELRGAWDARLEALLVDSVMRGESDESVRTRASALGWRSRHGVVVVVGDLPAGADAFGAHERLIDDVRHSAGHAGLDALIAVQGDRLVVVLGGVHDADKAGAAVAAHFGDGPLVVGPLVADLLDAQISAREAIAGLRAAPGWPQAPRPVLSEDLLAERVLAGDAVAVDRLVDDVFAPLAEQGLLPTLSTFLGVGGSIEATARALFVHANTVRYRLRRAADLTGLTPTSARDAFTLQIALSAGRLAAARADARPARDL